MHGRALEFVKARIAAVMKKFGTQFLIIGIAMVIFTFSAALTATVPFVALG